MASLQSFYRPFADISNLSTLEDLSLGHNKLTGIFPVSSFNNHPKLTTLNLTNNLLQGPTPRFNNSKLTVDMRTGSNCFCLDDPGLACDSRVNILLSIAESMGYPRCLQRAGKEMILVPPTNIGREFHVILEETLRVLVSKIWDFRVIFLQISLCLHL